MGTVAEAVAQMPEIERKYKLEGAEYDNVVFGISDEFSAAAKLEQEKIAKLADGGELQALLDNGTYAAVEDGALKKRSPNLLMVASSRPCWTTELMQPWRTVPW